MTLRKANAQYLLYLSKFPLLTKSVTAGILAGLNEVIASSLTKDFQKINMRDREIKHVFSPKLLTMIIYGSFIVTPISHKMYGTLNKIFRDNLSFGMKFLQILTSLTTITPTLAAVFTSWVAIINNYKLPSNLKTFDAHTELLKIRSIVVKGLKSNYLTILKTSVMTSLVSLVIAQNFIKAELWVVFFNAVYFVLGTIQNTKMKRLNRNMSLADVEKEQ